MEDPAVDVVFDGLAVLMVTNAPREIIAKKRRESNDQVTAFQTAIAMPDLMDPQPNGSGPNTSDPSGSDDTSPSSFLGTPYSTTLQFDYPFPISNAPRDPALPPTPLPSALPIASSIGSAPSIVTAAAAASEENSEFAPANYLPSLVSSIAASPDLPVNNNLSDLRSLPNKSTSSLNSTHSGHTAPGMMTMMPSGASLYSISPSSSFQSNSHLPFTVAGPTRANSNGGSIMSRNKGRPNSLNLSQMPPPSLSLQTNMVKAVQLPPTVRRPKARAVSSFASTGSDMSRESISVSAGLSHHTSGSVSSLSIASVSLLAGPGEPPIPPSLLNKLGQRPRKASTASNTSSYFTANVNIYKTHNSRDFFGSPINEGVPPFASAPAPPTLGTDSSVDIAKPLFSPSKANFTIPRPSLGRSSSTNTHGLPTFNKPFFGRASTAQQVSTQVTNSAFQSRAYAQHLRHQQEQQKLKLQEELRKKAEKAAKEVAKAEKKKEKKERRRRPSLSLSRTPSASSSSSSKTKASSQSKSPPSSSASQTEMFKLSPSQRISSENAVDESEDSTSPEGMRRMKPRRRSSVRRALEKTGSLVASGFRLELSTSKRAGNPTPY